MYERICYRSQGLRLARKLKDDYCTCSMANNSACALMLGGRLPHTLGELKTLRAEADEAHKRAKKYMSKIVLMIARGTAMDAVSEKVVRISWAF